ncbi:carbohydrate porin [Polaromonas naphthalenivorans]|uniref:Raffinose porin n=1 Tax=Polaromonas naphthalenivorans (strain CJ2) TaxID=365044 RepID=A1VIS2_POLNA|nr:carbohydrate porin [Polaromonas naphthalenivorans]ABM35550.1 raffinose porin [Polaromonas naphthalenivorans CJ2]
MNNLSKTAIALAVTLVTASAAHAAEFNANLELDSTYLNNNRGLSQSGRVEVNAVGKVGSNYFVAGRASLLAKKDGAAATDDMWVQLGSSTADLKLGRFEAADLFRLPRDVLVLYATGDGVSSVYRANVLRGRAGSEVFQAAGTVNLGSGLSFELGAIETRATVGTLPGAAYVAPKGLRPVLSYEQGPWLLRAGLESIKYNVGGKTRTGFGFTGSYNFSDFTLVGNAAANKDASGNKQTSYALIGDTKFGLGGGLIFGNTKLPAGSYKVTTAYAAYTFPLFDIKGATVTPAVSFSKAGGVNRSNDETGVRVRFNYNF